LINYIFSATNYYLHDSLYDVGGIPGKGNHLAKLEQRNENELLVSSHHDGTNGNSGCGEAHSEAEEALQVVMEASVHHPTIVEEE